MNLKTIARRAAGALLFVPLAACGSSSFGEGDIVVPSLTEAKAQAEKDITPDNANDELEKLEAEIEADAKGG